LINPLFSFEDKGRRACARGNAAATSSAGAKGMKNKEKEGNFLTKLP
jgi:hypothetical protein